MFIITWQILFSTDYILMPVLALIWILLARTYRNINYRGKIFAKYFLPALIARFAGAILTGIMYQHYYGYGDTYYYFFGTKDIFNTLFNSPVAAYEMLFVDISDWNLTTHSHVTFRGIFGKPKEAMVIKICGFFSPLGLGTYIGTSFTITVFSFLGCWGIYRVFYDLYPHLHKRLAIVILFLPSLCFWGTGIMKDSLVIAGLGFYINGIYYGIIRKRKKILRSLFLIIVGILLMKSIKIYVLVSIIPATILWVFFMYKTRIKNPILEKIASPVFLVFGALGGYLIMQQLGSIYSQFTFEGFIEEAKKVQWWLKLSTERDGGSGYDLGELDPSPSGLLKIFPKAINVTLFRPYLWEAKKLILIPTVIESFLTLLFTIYVFFKTGVFRLLRILLRDPVILFCMTFSLIFAFCVGFTSFNFGALARYKIPCLPFYFIGLILILDKVNNKDNYSVGTDSKLKPESE